MLFILKEKMFWIKLLTINDEEKNKIVNLINEKYSIYSDNDHIVPFKILKEYSLAINSNPIFIPGIGHMGKKIGLEELPEVIDLILKSNLWKSKWIIIIEQLKIAQIDWKCCFLF